MQKFNMEEKIVTKDLPTSGINHINELSTVEKNSKFTRLVWRTHNDFHNHKFWEICLVLKGKGKHYFPTGIEDMYTGTMWLLRPHDVHKIEPLPQDSPRGTTYAHRDIYIEDATMRRILNALGDSLYENFLNAPSPLFAILPPQETH